MPCQTIRWGGGGGPDFPDASNILVIRQVLVRLEEKIAWLTQRSKPNILRSVPTRFLERERFGSVFHQEAQLLRVNKKPGFRRSTVKKKKHPNWKRPTGRMVIIIVHRPPGLRYLQNFATFPRYVYLNVSGLDKF
jgi:hypothetical protein